jgi:hypothetical protein
VELITAFVQCVKKRKGNGSSVAFIHREQLKKITQKCEALHIYCLIHHSSRNSYTVPGTTLGLGIQQRELSAVQTVGGHEVKI